MNLVWIRSTVEQMSEATDYVSVPRDRWEAMTPAAREEFITDCALELMNQQGGCGASVVEAHEVPCEFRVPAEREHEARTS